MVSRSSSTEPATTPTLWSSILSGGSSRDRERQKTLRFLRATAARGSPREAPPDPKLRLFWLMVGWRLDDMGPFLLNVNAPSEMGTVCDCHARRYDVPVDRSFFANVDSLRRSNVAVDHSRHDHGLGKDLGLDPAGRPDGQHVISEFDCALDRPFHSEVFAAAQLAFHDDRFADGDDSLTIAGGRRSNDRAPHRRRRTRRRGHRGFTTVW